MHTSSCTRRTSVLILSVALAAGLPMSGSGQTSERYRAALYKTFVTSGLVKVESCDGLCYEGHDCTTCVGVRVFREGAIYTTTIYDKTKCCEVASCGIDPRYGLCGTHECPANDCPSLEGPFYASIAPVIASCVGAGESFYVPSFTAVLGNLSNDAATCGGDCAAVDFFQVYRWQYRTDDNYGGFWTSCPNPSDIRIDCQPIADPSVTCGTTTDPTPAPTPAPTPTPPPACGSNNNVCFPSLRKCLDACCGVCERRISCGSETAHKCFE